MLGIKRRFFWSQSEGKQTMRYRNEGLGGSQTVPAKELPLPHCSPTRPRCRPVLLATSGHTVLALVWRPLMATWPGLGSIYPGSPVSTPGMGGSCLQQCLLLGNGSSYGAMFQRPSKPDRGIWPRDSCSLCFYPGVTVKHAPHFLKT